MAFRIYVGIVVIFMSTFVIGHIQAQELHGDTGSKQIGSIIQNSTESNIRKAVSLGGAEFNGSSAIHYSDDPGLNSLNDDSTVQESHACYSSTNPNFAGFMASMTVYNPAVKYGQMSKSFITIKNTANNQADEEIEAGWMVDPLTYGDTSTRFYAHVKGAYCANVDCRTSVFVIRDGAYLKPGDLLDEGNHLTLKFLKDTNTGNWVLCVGPSAAYLSELGHFPASLFSRLSSQATAAEFGGCVKFINSLTGPPMGNGVYARDNIPPGQPTPTMITDVNFIKPHGCSKPMGFPVKNFIGQCIFYYTAWFTGFTASITVYNPPVVSGQMSKSYIIQNTFNKPSDGIDEISAGWVGANGRSCMNLSRDGFRYIQGSYLAPGDAMDAGNRITIKFLKDTNTGDWGLFVGPGIGDTYLSKIGYFPKYLFTGLAESGNYAEFGGAVRFINSLRSPPMGNGVYAKDLQGARDPLPAVMTNVYYIRPDGQFFDMHYRRLYSPTCYGLGRLMIQDDHFGYGGPGGCS